MHLEHILFSPPAPPRYFYLCSHTTPCSFSLSKKAKEKSNKQKSKQTKPIEKGRGKTVQKEI